MHPLALTRRKEQRHPRAEPLSRSNSAPKVHFVQTFILLHKCTFLLRNKQHSHKLYDQFTSRLIFVHSDNGYDTDQTRSQSVSICSFTGKNRVDALVINAMFTRRINFSKPACYPLKSFLQGRVAISLI